MFTYYSERLSADRLERCYALAPPAIQRYLEAEILHILRAIRPGDRVLELGCGYGRVLARLAPEASLVVGIDVSLPSLALAASVSERHRLFRLAAMDAVALGFRPGSFDLVCCPQNGISAFHVDQRKLLESAVRAVASGGRVQLFSYAVQLWEERLAWFRLQAAEGLVGEIDEAATGNGTIVCRDGFTATTVSRERFAELARGLGRSFSVSILDHASVVCEINV
ncbi:MAG: class I SAM-dependent methyltransferase [Acidobacteriia bacterium]|nr:class I SAM-dependent methyltransferase [Terriglobia bacterium]